MADCVIVDEGRSGPMNGWVCSITGSTAPHDLAMCYCSSDVDCIYCPVRGGDDHIRNPEPLTQEICDSIIQSATAAVGAAQGYYSEALYDLMYQAADTGYELLLENIRCSAMYQISPPSLSGEYVDLVLTDNEKELARDLESNLNTIFAGLQPGEYVGQCYLRGCLRMSSSKLYAIEGSRDSWSSTCYEAFDVGIDCIPKYKAPLESMLEAEKQECLTYFYRIRSGISEAGSTFESGTEAVLGCAGGDYNSWNGFVPGWRV